MSQSHTAAERGHVYFELGSKVREVVTGYTGIVTGFTEWLYACNRYSVKPIELKDGKPQDSIALDEYTLRLEAPPTEELIVTPTPFTIELGSKAKDRVTGFSGIVVGRTQWLHGCNCYYIQSKEMKNGKPVPAQGFDEDAIEVEVPAPPHKTRETGGPCDLPTRQADRIDTRGR